MTNIRLVSTSIIKPATDHQDNNSCCRIELNPCDLRQLLTAPIQKGLIFHNKKVDHDHDHNTLVQHLKSSLSNTLDIFYPLAGRLAIVENDDDTTSFFIDCNGAGALFVHAAADDVAVSDVLKSVNVPEDVVSSFFAMSGELNYEGVSKPLLAVQLTALADGLFIGCTLNHAVADGTSFWHFFNTWSAISSDDRDRRLRVSVVSILTALLIFLFVFLCFKTKSLLVFPLLVRQSHSRKEC